MQLFHHCSSTHLALHAEWQQRCCSNRCAALLKLQKAGKALADADTCIRLKPDWEKGYYRKAMVLEAMGDLSQV